MVLLLCVIIIPIFTQYYQQATKAYISEQQAALDSSTSLFNAQLRMLEDLLEDCLVTRSIPNVASSKEISAEDYWALRDVGNGVIGISSSSAIVSDVFVIFQNSNTVISENGIFTTLGSKSGKDRFRDFYQFIDEATATQILDTAVAPSQYVYLTKAGFRTKQMYSTSENVFAYGRALGSLSNTYVYIFINKSAVDSMFATVDGHLTFSVQGESLFSTGTNEPAPKENDSLFITSTQANRINVSARLNSKHYQTYLQSTLYTIVIFAISVVLLSIALAVYSAYSSCKPLKQVVSKLKECYPDHVDTNEAFAYLLSGIESLHNAQASISQQLASAQTSLEQNYLEQHLHMPASLSKEVRQQINISNFPSQYVVCYMVASNTAMQEESDLRYFFTVTSNTLASELNAIHQPLSPSSFILIIPAVSKEDVQLQLLQERVAHINNIMGLSISFAVSSVCNSISQLNAAYEFTRSAIAAQSVVQAACPSASLEINYLDSRQLYDAILEANYPLAREILSNIMMQCPTDISFRQRFYYGRMPILLAKHVLMPHADEPPPQYSSALSPLELFQELDDSLKRLCAVAQQQIQTESLTKETTARQAEQERIINYILENYVFDTLSVQSICSECAISEKAANEICRNATGMSVSAYIQQLRLDKASSMLRNTDAKVNDILKACGYNTNNAFYKAFKRVYGKTPSEYREFYHHL